MAKRKTWRMTGMEDYVTYVVVICYVVAVFVIGRYLPLHVWIF